MASNTENVSIQWRHHDVGYPSETHLKPKSRGLSFAHNLILTYPIVLKFCGEHGDDTAMLSTKFQSDYTIETGVMDEREFTRFDFMMRFGRIFCIAQGPRRAGSDLIKQGLNSMLSPLTDTTMPYCNRLKWDAPKSLT